MSKKTAVIICPGRGTYNKTELGYLHQIHHQPDKKKFFDHIDNYRSKYHQPSIWELDGKKDFSVKDHLPGENSAALIYACSYADFLDIDRSKIDIVAVTGNSMGWYLASAVAGVYNDDAAIHLINTMGSQMKDHIIGGQIIYPEVSEDWIFSQELSTLIDQKIAETNLLPDHFAATSIYFGGLRVIGGNEVALKKLLKELPPREGRYPFRLMGNAAFHTSLLTETSIKAKKELGIEYFSKPSLPLVDGRGKIWMPHSTDIKELWDYTLGAQVDEPYHFSKSIEVVVKEFAPDYLIITGPGMTLGGAVAQTLIHKKCKNLKNKDDFKQLQSVNPYIISMADNVQRKIVI